jgi:fatty acid desaturase
MSDNRPTRRQRENKAYRLTLTAGGFSLAAAVTFILALVSSFSWLWFIVCVIVAGLAGMALKSSVR